MNRESFLSRVREAARRGTAYRVHVPELPDGVGYVGVRGDICGRFAEEVHLVGGSAQVVDTWETAQKSLLQLLDEYQCRAAFCWQHEVLERLDLHRLLHDQGVHRRDYNSLRPIEPAERQSLTLSADIGITSADLAIAETGTLVMCSRPGQERAASLVPPVHVAIVTADQIVPDLFDALLRLPQPLPSNTAFITGPSKTGDIELQLTTGVHGPGKLHVVVIAEHDQNG